MSSLHSRDREKSKNTFTRNFKSHKNLNKNFKWKFTLRTIFYLTYQVLPQKSVFYRPMFYQLLFRWNIHSAGIKHSTTHRLADKQFSLSFRLQQTSRFETSRQLRHFFRVSRMWEEILKTNFIPTTIVFVWILNVNIKKAKNLFFSSII